MEIKKTNGFIAKSGSDAGCYFVKAGGVTLPSKYAHLFDVLEFRVEFEAAIGCLLSFDGIPILALTESDIQNYGLSGRCSATYRVSLEGSSLLYNGSVVSSSSDGGTWNEVFGGMSYISFAIGGTASSVDSVDSSSCFEGVIYSAEVVWGSSKASDARCVVCKYEASNWTSTGCVNTADGEVFLGAGREIDRLLCTYDVTSTTEPTHLTQDGDSYAVFDGNYSNIRMFVDGVETNFAVDYTFAATGSHEVLFVFNEPVSSSSETFVSTNYRVIPLVAIDPRHWDVSLFDEVSSFMNGTRVSDLDAAWFNFNYSNIWFFSLYGGLQIVQPNLSILDTNSVATLQLLAKNSVVDFAYLNREFDPITTSLNGLFYKAAGLQTVDLRDWSFSSKPDLDSMFAYCSDLTSVYLMADLRYFPGPNGYSFGNGEGLFGYSGPSTNGVFHSNILYDISKALNGTDKSDPHFPSTWTNEYHFYFGRGISLMPSDLADSAWGVQYANGTYTPSVLSEGVDLYAWFDTKLFGDSTVHDTVKSRLTFNGNACTAINVDSHSFSFGETTVTVLADGSMQVYMPNLLKAVYNVTSTASETQLLFSSFSLYGMSKMLIDGVEVSPVRSYTFDSEGQHEVSFIFDIQNGTAHMFTACSALVSVDGSSFSLGGSSMTKMFSGCSNLTTVKLASLDVSSVQNFSSMFSGCTSLTGVDVGGWDVTSGTNFQGMFLNCYSLVSLDLDGWTTTAATSFRDMCASCIALESFSMRNLIASSVTTVMMMFSGCRSLSDVALGFNPSSVTSYEDVFYNIADSGVFHYRPSYDYSAFISYLPSGWSSVGDITE